jgi:CRP-like cAMP-binding protein
MRQAQALNAMSSESYGQQQGAPSGGPLDRLRRVLPGTLREMTQGQTLSLEGEPNGRVVGILSGLARCFRLTANGRRHICRFVGAGGVIGLGLLGVQRHSTEAVSAGQVVVFRTAAVEAAIEHDTRVRSAIMRALAEELAERERVQLRLGRLGAEQRVADFLLELSARFGAAGANQIPMPRADMADHLGVTIETVSRALHRFDRLGLIELIDLHQFRVLRRRALQQLIEGDEVNGPPHGV